MDSGITSRNYPLPQEGGAGGLGEEASTRAVEEALDEWRLSDTVIVSWGELTSS